MREKKYRPVDVQEVPLHHPVQVFYDMAFATGEPVLSASSLMQEERNFISVFRGVFPGRAGATRLIFLTVASIEERPSR